MASPHHLLAAAFGLFGLLFLLHIDSVNSLRCIFCDVSFLPRCGRRLESTSRICHSRAVCSTLVWYYYDGTIRVMSRRCDGGGPFDCFSNPLLRQQLIFYCDRDNCNNIRDPPMDWNGQNSFPCEPEELQRRPG